MMKQILIVAFGGAVGSVLRFLATLFISKYYSNSFPAATFVINILGCFFIGIIIGLLDQNIQTNNNLKLLLITGFCGGFTTFSTFSLENIFLLQTNNYLTSILYIVSSLLVGFLAVWIGMLVTK